jgi:hypothetical protein
MTGKNKTQKNTAVLWIENALSDLPVFSFAKIWQQASIISLHKEGTFGIPLPSFQDKQVANCKRGREAVIHPCILLRAKGEAT